MGRKVMRVPLRFDWPIGKVWDGYVNPHWKACPQCDGRGTTVAAEWLNAITHLLLMVGDALATWERSREVLPVIRQMGYPAALVFQDDIEATAIPWDAFDCAFIGGTTHWKLSEAAWTLVGEAKARRKHVHFGRTNSRIRLFAAAKSGCDSADGTMVAFGPDKRLPQLLGWLDELQQQPLLEMTA